MFRTALIASLALHAALFMLATVRWSLVKGDSSGLRGSAARVWTEAPAGVLFDVSPEASTPSPELRVTAPGFDVLPPTSTPPANPASALIPKTALPPISGGVPAELPANPRNGPASRGGKGGYPRNLQSTRGAGGAAASAAAGGRDLNGSGYLPPTFSLRYKPVYPEEARAKHLEGAVLLFLSIDPAGDVTNASVKRSSGHAILDRAALAAVRSWRFDPARQNGVPVSARVEAPVEFRFKGH